MTKEKIKDLIAKMTLEEKAAMCSGADFWHTESCERLGIPASMVSDGPHGLRKQDDKADHLGVNESIKAVCFPAGCGTAASLTEICCIIWARHWAMSVRQKASVSFWGRL